MCWLMYVIISEVFCWARNLTRLLQRVSTRTSFRGFLKLVSCSLMLGEWRGYVRPEALTRILGKSSIPNRMIEFIRSRSVTR